MNHYRRMYSLLPLMFLFFGRTDAQSVEVGQPCPDMQIRHVVNYAKSSIRISDYKGKLLLFDFGSTGCSPCVRLLPELDSLQRVFGDKIQIFWVTNETTEKVMQFLSRNPKVKNLSIPVITRDTMLAQTFKHVATPHEAWVDRDGIVLSQTSGEYVTSENIRKALAGEKVNWLVKHEENYDYTQPIISLNEKNVPPPINKPEHPQFYYSSFTNYLDGVAPRFSTKLDSGASAYRISMINQPIIHLYLIAWGKVWTTFPPNNVLVETKDSTKFFDKKMRVDEWKMNNTFCYESSLPISMSKSLRENKMRTDLDVYLGMHGRLEDRNVECWQIVKGENSQLLYDRSLSETLRNEKLKQGDKGFLTLEQAVWDMNFSGNYPPIVDATGYTPDQVRGHYMGGFRDKKDFQTLQTQLNYYGLALVKTRKNITMLVISDLTSSL